MDQGSDVSSIPGAPELRAPFAATWSPSPSKVYQLHDLAQQRPRPWLREPRPCNVGDGKSRIIWKRYIGGREKADEELAADAAGREPKYKSPTKVVKKVCLDVGGVGGEREAAPSAWDSCKRGLRHKTAPSAETTSEAVTPSPVSSLSPRLHAVCSVGPRDESPLESPEESSPLLLSSDAKELTNHSNQDVQEGPVDHDDFPPSNFTGVFSRPITHVTHSPPARDPRRTSIAEEVSSTQPSPVYDNEDTANGKPLLKDQEQGAEKLCSTLNFKVATEQRPNSTEVQLGDGATESTIKISAQLLRAEPDDMSPDRMIVEEEAEVNDIQPLQTTSILTEVAPLDSNNEEKEQSLPPIEQELVAKVPVNEETDMLLDFLKRTNASKAARIAKISALSHRRDSGAVQLALASPRKALEGVDPNSPSPRKRPTLLDSLYRKPTPSPLARMDVDVAETEEEVQEAQAAVRRSSRRCVEKPTSEPAPAKIPNVLTIRRTDDQDKIALKRSEAQELATTLRSNTRRNKGGAVSVRQTLLKLSNANIAPLGQVMPQDEQVESERPMKLRWAPEEQLLHFFVDEQEPTQDEENSDKTLADHDAQRKVVKPARAYIPKLSARTKSVKITQAETLQPESVPTTILNITNPAPSTSSVDNASNKQLASTQAAEDHDEKGNKPPLVRRIPQPRKRIPIPAKPKIAASGSKINDDTTSHLSDKQEPKLALTKQVSAPRSAVEEVSDQIPAKTVGAGRTMGSRLVAPRRVAVSKK